MTHPLTLGVGCTRQQGKDTLAALLRQLDPRFTPFSFARALKEDLDPFLRQHYGVDIWTCSTEQKEWVRPLLISHGMAMRARDPDHWVKRTIADIKAHLAREDIIPIVTDCRFVNEVSLMHAAFPGFRYVNVTREGAPPPTEEETRHAPAVAAMADYALHWGGETEAQQLDRAREMLAWLRP